MAPVLFQDERVLLVRCLRSVSADDEFVEGAQLAALDVLGRRHQKEPATVGVEGVVP